MADTPSPQGEAASAPSAKTSGSEGQKLATEINRRRTFAIISHPDAGKTTLTEKLLLFGGAIQLAGQVKAKKDGRATRSDWMAIEKARGISVATSVMTFEYGGAVFNLLDTPGHEDFSDDTYRTLTAVDSAIMVIDAARGIETRTRKLFEICRMRDIPIVTFVNKMDRESRDPLDLLDEIEKMLALDTAPMVWPIGQGREFRGTYDLYQPRVRRLDQDYDGQPVTGPDDPLFTELLEPDAYQRWREEIGLALEACGKFDLEQFQHGALTPVYFGSALKNFGVRDVLDALKTFAPPPRTQHAATREIKATEPAMTGIIFKIQANMDPNHRDRIAFMRVCSGKLSRGMKVKHVRSGKTMALSAPQFFFAQDRSIAEEAYAGDVVGIPNRGTLRIGDALTEGEDITFLGIPSFAPEILRRIRLEDAIKAKKLKDAMREMAEEGVVQVFSPLDGTQPVVGVIGALQLDVLADRLTHEYGLKTDFDPAPCDAVRWIRSKDPAALKKFIEQNRSYIATDLDGDYVYLPGSIFTLNYNAGRNPEVEFLEIKS
ncbi:MAG: peptide chain release factor 3 [Hyphomicrobium zavarzinii]|uniref:peptide chain release factor 3 n=1 Tax=Hyphomicrobium zavarzinii TaxID=48292 RepID=UPI001A502383|nr:peptide chain release factor 3 [Hyphomicrobium zavarzinii]MBL8847479.1 peptide chain release factor 3 [Hyphomicrobium zavarzinii]